MSTIIMTRLQTLVDRNPAPLILDTTQLSRVFNHKSLFALPAHIEFTESEPEDWERLAFLGDNVLSLYTSEVLFRRYPRAKTSFLTNRKTLVVSNDQVARLSNAYGFPNQIQAHASQITVVRNSVNARAAVFEAYLAAVYLSEGTERAENWIKPLIDLILTEADERDASEEGEGSDEEEEEEDNILSAQSAHMPPTPRSLPAPRSSTSMSSSTSTSYASSASQGGGFLALFNQIASQKRIFPSWETSRTGPDHRPMFVATVSVNGREEGKGQAFNKQTARHLAAKEALRNLRWHTE
ncbi:hypothetical protein FRC17_009106 [Serendipita sp. 399]|nr:hypothetical protein FRC17_009106 [Serendipita sp. 399]